MIDPRLQTLRILRSHGTVTAAAGALHLTPSTVSQQLKQLAADTGVELLEPDGRRVRLTAAAEVLLEHADLLHAQWERARVDLAAHANGETGRLRICGLASVLAAYIAPAAARLRAEQPGTKLQLAAGETHECFQWLEAGDTDIAVVHPTVGTPPPSDRRFDQQLLTDDIEDLLVPTDHPWAGRDSVALAEAAHEDWIGSPTCVDQHQLLLSATAEAGFSPNFVHTGLDWYSVSSLVCSGFGVTLFPRLAAIPPEHAVVRVPLRGHPRPARRLFTAVRRGSAEQPTIARGLAAIRELARDRQQSSAGRTPSSTIAA